MSESIVGGAPDIQGSAENVGTNDNSVSYENHQRLLKQKKQADEKVRLLEEREQALELEKQKAEGRKDEVIQSLETQLNEEKGKSVKFVKSMTEKTLKSEITKAALSKGIRPDRVDKFLKLASDSFKDSEIQIDEDFNIVNRDVFNSVFEKEVESSSEWFMTSSKPPADVVPNEGGFVSIPDKKLSEKSVDELADML